MSDEDFQIFYDEITPLVEQIVDKLNKLELGNRIVAVESVITTILQFTDLSTPVALGILEYVKHVILKVVDARTASYLMQVMRTGGAE